MASVCGFRAKTEPESKIEKGFGTGARDSLHYKVRVCQYIYCAYPLTVKRNGGKTYGTMPEGMVKMKTNDILWATGVIATGVILFGVLLLFVGVCDVAYSGNSDAAKFAGWVIKSIR